MFSLIDHFVLIINQDPTGQRSIRHRPGKRNKFPNKTMFTNFTPNKGKIS